MFTEGEDHLEFHRYLTREEGNNITEARAHIKLIQQELDEKKSLPKEEEVKQIK